LLASQAQNVGHQPPGKVACKVARRACNAQRSDGLPCRAPPLLGSDFCAVHDPANAEAMAEARKLGGVRRKREVTLAGAYDFEGLDTVQQLRRLLLVAAFDMLGQENTPARARTIVAIVLAGAKLLEVGEFEERLEALEAAKHQHDGSHRSLFDLDEEDPFPLPGEGL
jgi:hypothetical protein